MIHDLSKMRIFVRPGSTDLRKAVNGLSILADSQMGKNPFEANLFLFSNADRKLLKALYWDRNGFCLWQKRLEKDRFPWPTSAEEAKEITCDQLTMLLAGIDFWKAHQEIKLQKVS